ncbi:MAG: HU family DNA-binding protein [Gammaproteobacteria bacterium]|nr:HU family DNA-binding protein [Gammaproteobacteria bacterium]
MTKAELIAAIAEKTGATKVDVDAIFTATFDTIAEALTKQDKVAVPKFGNFATKIREERKGRNPSTGKEMIIPRSVVVNFKPAIQLKESVNSKSDD